jgi:hypothetical protein
LRGSCPRARARAPGRQSGLRRACRRRRRSWSWLCARGRVVRTRPVRRCRRRAVWWPFIWPVVQAHAIQSGPLDVGDESLGDPVGEPRPPTHAVGEVTASWWGRQ